MTVAGLIEQYNNERPNQVDDDVKVLWLRKCEQMLINEIFLSHKHDLEDEAKQKRGKGRRRQKPHRRKRIIPRRVARPADSEPRCHASYYTKSQLRLRCSG